MELLTVIKCLAARGCGGARPNPSIIGARSSCVLCMYTHDIRAAPFMHCVHHYSAEGFAL